jgi:hypothetical protein
MTRSVTKLLLIGNVSRCCLSLIKRKDRKPAQALGQREIQRSDARSREGMEQPSSRRLTSLCGLRVNGAGVIEVVVRMDVGFV